MTLPAPKKHKNPLNKSINNPSSGLYMTPVTPIKAPITCLQLAKLIYHFCLGGGLLDNRPTPGPRPFRITPASNQCPEYGKPLEA